MIVAFFARDVSVCVDPELVRDQTVEEYFMSLRDGQPEPVPEPTPEPEPVAVLVPATRSLTLKEIIARNKSK